jgi:hypothetical protein
MRKITFFIAAIIFSTFLYSQSLQNGGFEDGYNGWTAYSQAGDDIVGTAAFFASTSIDPPVDVRSGSYMARLGGYSYNVNYLAQTVTLPVANPVKLEIYCQSRSFSGTECSGLYVGAKVNVYISGTSIYEVYLCYYNDVWQWTYGYFDLTAVAGQQVEIKFSAEAANSMWSYIYFDDINISPSTTGIMANDNICASNIEQNYPNPFSETTSIKYFLDTPGETNLKIFNQYGQEVITVFDEYKTQGEHSCNICGLNLSDGIYYYQITSGDLVMTKKMSVVK